MGKEHNGEICGVVDELREFADQVRIAPFLEGVPMSIHGVVFPTSTAVFRPVELITLRYRERSRFLWGGCSTSYDPSDRDRVEMREVARRAGNALKENVNFRGPFSIDGVITETRLHANGTQSSNVRWFWSVDQGASQPALRSSMLGCDGK